MADRYISNAETQEYGPSFRRNAEKYRGLDPIVAQLIDGQQTVDEAMAVANRESSSLVGDRSVAAKAKQPVFYEVVDAMNGFHDYLGSLRGPKFAMSEFFPDGTKASGGRTPAERVVGLQRLIDGLAKHPDVPAAAERQAALEELRDRLAVAVKNATHAAHERYVHTPQQRATRKAWLAQYHASKLIMEGLLMLHGRHEEFPALFADLTAPTRTAAPPVAPAPTPAPATP